jgi:signal transduction histidine kinase
MKPTLSSSAYSGKNVLPGMPTVLGTLHSPTQNISCDHGCLSDASPLQAYSPAVSRALCGAGSALYEILGMAELIRVAYQKGELISVQERLSLLIEETTKLSALISNIVDLSRNETDPAAPTCKQFDLTTLLHEVSQMGRRMAGTKPITVMDVSAPAPLVIESDPDMIRRIMTELVSNAVKFTERGRVAIILCKEDEFLRMTVADNGRGMTPEQVKDLFGIFDRANDTEAGKGREPSGMGLRIVKTMVKLLGGSITASSRIGEGTIVEVTLSLKTMNGSLR